MFAKNELSSIKITLRIPFFTIYVGRKGAWSNCKTSFICIAYIDRKIDSSGNYRFNVFFTDGRTDGQIDIALLTKLLMLIQIKYIRL